jgi:hypothetical protein
VLGNSLGGVFSQHRRQDESNVQIQGGIKKTIFIL